jgi:hypothetical protein
MRKSDVEKPSKQRDSVRKQQEYPIASDTVLTGHTIERRSFINIF